MTRRQDAARRALTLLAGCAHDLREMSDPEWVWDILGENDGERVDAVIALCGISAGLIPDLAERVARLGLAIDELKED